MSYSPHVSFKGCIFPLRWHQCTRQTEGVYFTRFFILLFQEILLQAKTPEEDFQVIQKLVLKHNRLRVGQNVNPLDRKVVSFTDRSWPERFTTVKVSSGVSMVAFFSPFITVCSLSLVLLFILDRHLEDKVSKKNSVYFGVSPLVFAYSWCVLSITFRKCLLPPIVLVHVVEWHYPCY